ncbi:hypothetical protein F5Y09DRAFT_324190, partial [Xylaria sp. FL1042]
MVDHLSRRGNSWRSLLIAVPVLHVSGQYQRSKTFMQTPFHAQNSRKMLSAAELTIVVIFRVLETSHIGTGTTTATNCHFEVSHSN